MLRFSELLEKNSAAANFLVLLSLFPEGITLEEIDTMSNVELIDKDYKALLKEIIIEK
jgi:hypothetical protein